MKNLKMFLSSLIAVFAVQITCLAATPGPNFTAGISGFKYSGLHEPGGLLGEIMHDPSVTGNYTQKDTSINPEIGVGYCLNTRVCLDLSYTEAKLMTNMSVSNVNVGTVSFSGMTYNLGNLSTDINLNRDGKAQAWRVSASYEHPVWEDHIGILVRGGVYVWNAHVRDTATFDSSGISISYDEYDHGTDYFVSGGAVFNLGKQSGIIIEGTHIKDVTKASIVFRHEFDGKFKL